MAKRRSKTCWLGKLDCTIRAILMQQISQSMPSNKSRKHLGRGRPTLDIDPTDMSAPSLFPTQNPNAPAVSATLFRYICGSSYLA